MKTFSWLDTQPARTPVNASTTSSRMHPHDSEPVWLAKPSPYETLIHNTSPASAGARVPVSPPVEDVVLELNPMLSGWANYFSLGSVSRAYRIVDNHVSHRLRMWLNAKHKVHCVGRKRFTDVGTLNRLGVFCLQRLKGSLPWATA